MTPQELKASILQLAIQGKLVPQLPEEGTGEELYQQIQKEKQRLIKEGKIKKEKPLPEITDDEIPFDIPESWKWVRIGNIGSWSSGATPSRTQAEYYGGNIPWLKTGDLNDGYVSEIPETITELALEKTSVRLNPIGSVLMAMYGATIGKLGILQIEATTNQACCACIPYDGMWNKFLFYILMANRKAFIKMGEGGAQPNISKEKIVKFLIPLPPLAEQKRIVAKIEELLPLIDRYEKAWGELEEFNKRFPVDMQKSILQTAIQGKLVPQLPEEGTGEELYQQIQKEKQRLIEDGKIKKEKPLPEIAEDEKPYDTPTNWTWVRFGELVNECFQGVNTAADHIVFEKENGIPIIQTGDITSGKLNIVGTKLMSIADYDKYSYKYQPRYNDIFYCNIGTIGKPYIFTESYQMLFHWNLFIIRYNYECILPMYLKMYLEYCTDYFKKNTDGTAMQFVSKKKLVNVLVPLPPLAEQKRIVAKLEEILPLCEKLK